MLRASLDIGSNSILLLIARMNEGEVIPLLETFFYPRLGSGLSETGKLSQKSMKRAEENIAQSLEICRKRGVKDIRAAATAAVREAGNGGEFVDRIKTDLGLEIRIVDGETEAELTYIGCTSDIEKNERVAVFDVGGGSSECTVGSGKVPLESMSAPIGAVKLTDRFGKNPGLVPEAQQLLVRQLRPLSLAAKQHRLIGVGGTITTLAAVKLGLQIYDADTIAAVTFTADELEEKIERFRSLTSGQIANLPGMEPTRADIIEAGATIIRSFMDQAQIDKIEVNPRGFRYGLLLKD